MRTSTVYKLVYVRKSVYCIRRFSFAQANLPRTHLVEYPVNEWVESPDGLLFAMDTLEHAVRYLHQVDPRYQVRNNVEIWRAQAIGKRRVDYARCHTFALSTYTATQFWKQHARPVLRNGQDVPYYCARTPEGTVGVERLRIVEQVWPQGGRS
jgi:hypothetical protein